MPGQKPVRRLALAAVAVSAVPLASAYLPVSFHSSSGRPRRAFRRCRLSSVSSRTAGEEVTATTSREASARPSFGDEGMDTESAAAWGDLAGGAYIPMDTMGSPIDDEDEDDELEPNTLARSADGKLAELRRSTDEVLSGDPGLSRLNSERKRNRTYGWLLESWSYVYSSEPDAPDRLADLLRQMEREVPHLLDVRVYTKIISVFAKSYRPEAGRIAEDILRGMIDASQEVNNGVAPNAYTYTAVIEAYANSADDPTGADSAERLLGELTTHYRESGGDPDLQPTSRTYNAVIRAWAASDHPSSAQLAEDCLRTMQGLYEAGDGDAKPESYNYNSVIHAWAASAPGDYQNSAAEKAEALLNEMESLHESGDATIRPTTVSYNAVIDCFAKTGGRSGAERAEELLRRMEDLYESGQNVDAKPNVRSFNSVLNAWAKSGTEEAALNAESILEFMEKLSDAGNNDVRPDVVAFATVINAWARSQRFGKADRAYNIFRHMQELYETTGNETVRPNVVIYNSVMNACAFTAGDVAEQNRAVEIAHASLKDLEVGGDGDPDQITYGTFLKVCLNQMPDSSNRRKVAALIFDNAKRDGQLGTMVLQNFRLLAPPDLYFDMVGRDIAEEVEVTDLPEEWSCNVVEGKWRRRRQLY